MNTLLGFSERELSRQVVCPRATGDMVVFYADAVTEPRHMVEERERDAVLGNGSFGRIDAACLMPVYGRIEHALDRDGQYNPV